ncbi:hypothetical protein P1X14_07830 [Sphingomonas sp. AOB5]|uniref:hypothetical protein n=1 Tax=Sphingomonas sp. AOB5 TaxID=3034017 RepID=UPI0023F745D5|nr:hypothetical protein [Sphingomonas sp. AOB5]MDF7775152.1 hypothetical protein [Sphingomonas sp. AOB5]
MLSLFGEEPCRATMITAQRAGLWHDMLAFIPAYSAFLALAAWAMRGADRRLALAAMAMLLLAGLLDEIEGVVLFRLLSGFPGAGGWFDALFWTVRPKFLLLGLGEIAIAALLVRGTWMAKIGAVPVAIGGAVSIWFLLADPRNALMMQGHRWAWTALLLVAILGAIRHTLVMRPKQA